MKRFTLIVVTILVVAAAAAAQVGAKRTQQAGAVVVTVTPVNLSEANAETVDFEVVVDTHSGDLDFEMVSIATLLGDEGPVSPSVWTGGRGGHHLKGKLSFPAGALRSAGRLILTLREIAGDKDLSFVWEASGRGPG